MAAVLCTVAVLPAIPASASRLPSVVDHLQSAGFHCEQRRSGVECVGRTDAYPEPVAVLIPTGFRYDGRVLVHLHGYVLGTEHDSSFAAILRDFEFLDRLSEAGVRNSLFVLPSSRGYCESYKDYFGKRDSFELWLDSILRASGLARPKRIVLSGHSGAYQPIEMILAQATQGLASRIRDLILLDATYSDLQVDRYLGWLRASRTHRLWDAFRPDTGTEKGSRALWSKLSSQPFSLEHANIWASGRGEILPGSNQGDAADHWGMVRVYYPDFLRK